MPTNIQQKRQQGFYFRVTTNFVVFCLLAVPLRFHLQWFGNLLAKKPDWLSLAFRSGPMYFYAITLCLESILRLEYYPELLYERRLVYLLRWLMILLSSLIFAYYLLSPTYKNGAPLLITINEQVNQIGTGVLALALSTLAHHYVTKQEMKMKRTKN